MNTYTTGTQRFIDYGGSGSTNIASDSAGNFVVVWHSAGQDGSGLGIFGQRYDSGGTPQGPEFRVNTFTTSGQRNPAVAVDGSGNIVVVWSGNGTPSGFVGVYGQRYSSSGAPMGAEFTVSTGHYEYVPAVAADAAGNFVVVWQDNEDGSGSGVRGQRFNSSGAPQGPRFQVNTTTGGGQGSPSVAAAATGGFVVVWDGVGPDTTDIFGQRYDSSGAPQGPEFLVNTFTTNFQRLPSVAADSAGNFVVAWEEYSYPARNISAQRFSSSGAPQGAEFRVNTGTPGTQTVPSVASDPAGNFVVAWRSPLDGSGDGVFAQRYSSAGAPQGPEFRVNTYTTGAQGFPSVAADSAGNFVVGWQSDGQDGSSYGIFAQRYGPIFPCGNGTLDTGEDCDQGGNNGNPAFCCTATCTFVAAGTQCRVSAGTCDPAESCTGASGTCPADAKSASECRAAPGDCDVAETCDGVSNDCPADGFKAATVECRPSAGVCDPAESCPGNGPACPADAKSSDVCRPVAGACDVAESCDGVNNACPADGFEASTVECRASAGVCDPAESCPGSGPNCPADAKSTAQCRAAAGGCDVAETCDGVNDDCPADGFQPASAQCRAAAGVCDVAETCDGLTNACPPDLFQLPPQVCRPAAPACDLAETCSGLSATCPPDGFFPDGTPCSDGNVCTANDECTGGVCAGEPSCNDHYLCYKVKSTTPFASVFANLVDQLETTGAAVLKPKALCPPANKNSEGVIDSVTHEESYQIKPGLAHVRRTNIEVIDQFGTLRVDTIKADRLLVPTNKGLGSPPPPVGGTVDHYKCYKVKTTAGTPKFPKGVQAIVGTQFETRIYDVRKPKRLCVPVDKNGEGITSSIAHLMCYQVKAASGQPKHVRVVGQIHTLNQFGPGRLDTIKEDSLCVPAQKNL